MRFFKTIHTAYFLASILLLAASNATAKTNLSGHFIAHSECPAYHSLKKQTNPGNIKTKINFTYDLIAKNKEKGSHFLIKMDAVPSQRWVDMSCGEHVNPVKNSVTTERKSLNSKKEQYVLAVSWQPAFCEGHNRKKECKKQSTEDFDASNFTLHGLWPQPRGNEYCRVSKDQKRKSKKKKWSKLRPLELQESTRRELKKVMPGYQSFLHRYEWTKHGSCYNKQSAEQYYADSIRLINDLNASSVRTLFANNIGKEITFSQIANAFEQSFGKGASKKMKIRCNNDGDRQLISELSINMSGELSKMKDAMQGAADINKRGCKKGIIDPAGFQ